MKTPQYYLMPLGSLIQYVVPRWLALRIAWFLVWLLFPSLTDQRRVIAENFRHILGRELESGEGDRIARRVLSNLAVCSADLLRGPDLTRRGRLRQIVAVEEHRAALDQVKAQGRGAIIVTAHLGNWDLGGVCVACDGYPLTAVYEKIPRGMSDAFNRFRGASGMELIDMGERERMNRAVEAGRFFTLLGDRDLKGNGLELPWFHGRRTFPRGAAAFSLRFGAPILIAYLVLEPGDRHHRYRLCIEPPLQFTPTGSLTEDLDALTARVVGRLEEIVARYPEQWFVFQPRWRAR